MWFFAEYQPTGFFSLRPASATSTGGRTLLVPTPFAIRMALLDAAIRTQGLAAGKDLFPVLREARIAIQLAPSILVNKVFTKVLRLKTYSCSAAEKPGLIQQAKDERQWPFQRTVAYREYVQFSAGLVLAISGSEAERLLPLLWQINYLGKRGGFLQMVKAPYWSESLPNTFTLLSEGIGSSFPMGVLQVVDDWAEDIAFEHVDVYSPVGMQGKRIFHQIVLPYRLTRSSRTYSLYERLWVR